MAIDEQRSALEASGWEFRDGTPGEGGIDTHWAFKHTATGSKTTQSGATLDQLCERCESWDADQARRA